MRIVSRTTVLLAADNTAICNPSHVILCTELPEGIAFIKTMGQTRQLCDELMHRLEITLRSVTRTVGQSVIVVH